MIGGGLLVAETLGDDGCELIGDNIVPVLLVARDVVRLVVRLDARLLAARLVDRDDDEARLSLPFD